MNNLRRLSFAFGLVAMTLAGAMPVRANEMVGVFQTVDGAQDYEVTYCGNGKQLCGKLIALHGAGDTEDNRRYIGKYIVENLNPAGTNVWKGLLTINNNSANGTATLIPGKELILKGCAYIILCAEFRMKQIR